MGTTGEVDAATVTIYPSAAALAADNDLRIASLAMAAYDYLITLPAEYRLYKSSSRRRLEALIYVPGDYTSISVLVVSNVGFFYHGFTPKSCEHYHLAAPALKVVQMMVSQAILGIRTYGIAQGNPWVKRTLLSTYILGAAVRFLHPDALRSLLILKQLQCCTVESAHPQRSVSTWTFYLVAMLYDCLTLSISIVYLMRVKSVGSGLLYDGLGYFVVLTLTNLANILLFRGTDHVLQSTGASFEYAVTWIMSQQILIHLRNARADRTSVFLAQIPSSRAVTSALRFDKGTRHQTKVEQVDTPELQDEFDLQVRIDRSIVVDTRAQEKGDDPKEDDHWDQV
ncbi:hypothetical protein V8E53_000623 [Lactarius tabidus]